jgi:hypothetical protein
MVIELDGSKGLQRKRARSHAFLLRCWQVQTESTNGESTWRFSLTHINTTREKKGFADLEALMTYLHQILIKEQSCSRFSPIRLGGSCYVHEY